MKKQIALLMILLSIYTLNIIAQSPNYFNYQAVVRDARGEILSSQPVRLRISIVEGNSEGNSVYKEEHSETTNQYGVISIKVGSGTNIIGSFTNIDWGNNVFFIKTELDLAGESDFKEISTIQLVSVPYALHAKTAENASLSGSEDVFNDWDKNGSDDFDGEFNSLSGIPTGLSDGDDNTQLNETQVEAFIDGGEISFNGWDKNASDDFSGNYNDLVNKPEIKDESGVNWVESSSAIKIQETASQLSSLQINVPSSGHVIVTASGFVNWLIKTTGEGKVTLKISNISDDITQPVQAIGVYGLSTSWYRRYPFSITRVFSVSAGENTFYLNGLLENDDGSAWVHNHTFVGVFVPTNY